MPPTAPKDPELLTEHARRALSNTIARIHMDETGVVRGITVGPKLEVALLGLFSPRAGPSAGNHSSRRTASVLAAARARSGASNATMVEGRPLPLLTPPSLRVGLQVAWSKPVLPNLPVVSLAELPPYVRSSAPSRHGSSGNETSEIGARKALLRLRTRLRNGRRSPKRCVAVNRERQGWRRHVDCCSPHRNRGRGARRSRAAHRRNRVGRHASSSLRRASHEQLVDVERCERASERRRARDR